MNGNSRFVFDTNVIVSALLFNKSVPGVAFMRSQQAGTLLISKSSVEELHDVLEREKFDRYLSRDERATFLELLIGELELVEITESIQACRDADDDRILELAVSGNATFVVTGDADLLELDPFRGVQIVTLARLLELLDC